MLGTTIEALASGRLTAKAGTIVDVFVRPWATPFGFAVGCLTLALFAFLAAVYLLLEAKEDALHDDSRRRALWAAVLANVLATVVVLLSDGASPEIRSHLVHTTVWLTTVVLAALCALGPSCVCGGGGIVWRVCATSAK